MARALRIYNPVLPFWLRTEVRFLRDPQIFELVTGSNEFATGRAIRLHSRGHSANRTALKTRLGRLQGHDQGVFVRIVPQVGLI